MLTRPWCCERSIEPFDPCPVPSSAWQGEADARERTLREKELMVAHLQQRGGERQHEEGRRVDELEQQLEELERQEYELLMAIDGHRAERATVYQQLDHELGGSSGNVAMLQAAPAAPGLA